MSGLTSNLMDVSGGKAALFVLLPVLVAATITDLRSRRIPNLLTFPAAALGVALHLALDGPGGAFSALVAYFVWFGGGLLFYRHVGGLGAGDIKLLMACAAFLGLWPTLYVAFASFALQTLWLFLRWIVTGTATINFRRLWDWVMSIFLPGVPLVQFTSAGARDKSPHGPFIMASAAALAALWWSGHVQF